MALTLDEVRELTVWSLAGHADCASPGGAGSPGAKLLDQVRTDVVEAVEYAREEEPDMPWRLLPERLADRLTEIADAAPDVYTYTRWQEFVDLAAWQEDPSELGSDGSDMTQAAAVCLYMIAERLAAALLQELAEQDEDEEDDEEEDEED